MILTSAQTAEGLKSMVQGTFFKWQYHGQQEPVEVLTLQDAWS